MQIFETLQLLIEAPRMNFCQSTIARRIILISFTQQALIFLAKSVISVVLFTWYLFFCYFSLYPYSIILNTVGILKTQVSGQIRQ